MKWNSHFKKKLNLLFQKIKKGAFSPPFIKTEKGYML